MKDARVAIRYAKSLLSLAIKQNVLEEIKEDIIIVNTVCKENRDFSNMLKSPIVKSETKIIILKKIFENKISSLSMNFVELIIEKKREAVLRSISESFISLYHSEKNIILASVTSATAITEDLRFQVLAQLKEVVGNSEIRVEELVDPSLIGGFVLRIGDREYNASAANKLQKLKREFVSNQYIKEY
jgi:F-type H+-transporting ATPase subunit delta